MKAGVPDAIRRHTLWATVLAFLLLAWATWLDTPFGTAPDFTAEGRSTVIAAPLTFHLAFYHPPSAWASFIAYGVTFAMSIAYLSERKLSHDTTARAAAEVGFLLNSIALATGTLWGIQEWYRSGQSGLATVYTDAKVLVVVVLWLTFAAYLMLRRLVDGDERRARLGSAFAVLGFLGVPASFLTSRIVPTDIHPAIQCPEAAPNCWSVPGYELALMALGGVAFTLLFIHLFLARLRLARLEARIDVLDDRLADPRDTDRGPFADPQET